MTSLHQVTFTSLAIVELSSSLRWPGTTPVSQALPWALAWSTILYRPSHTGLPSLNSRAGWHLGVDLSAPSDGRHVLVPMVLCLAKTGSAQKTGGIDDCRGQPYEKAPPPASPKAPPYRQRFGVIIDDPMQFAFANPLCLPTSEATCCSLLNRFCRGLPTLRQAACQTLWQQKARRRKPACDNSSISFVSYLLASKV